MEKERLEEIEEELSMSQENLLSYRDNHSAQRYRKATSDLYFAFEHIAKALLLSIGISPQTHKGVSRMLSYHFVRSGAIPTKTVVSLDNLYERRKIAEYSTRAGWEFTEEELKTYRGWATEGIEAILNELRKRMDTPIVKEIARTLKEISHL